eukprot:PhM_4_TR9369/c0_g1_i1/m.94242
MPSEPLVSNSSMISGPGGARGLLLGVLQSEEAALNCALHRGNEGEDGDEDKEASPLLDPDVLLAELRTRTDSLENDNVCELIQRNDEWTAHQHAVGDLVAELAATENRLDTYAARCHERLVAVDHIQRQAAALERRKCNLQLAHKALKELCTRFDLSWESRAALRDVQSCFHLPEGAVSSELGAYVRQNTNLYRLATAMQELERVLSTETSTARGSGIPALMERIGELEKIRADVAHGFDAFMEQYLRRAIRWDGTRLSKKGTLVWRSHDDEVFTVLSPLSPLLRSLQSVYSAGACIRLLRIYANEMKPVYGKEIVAYYHTFRHHVHARSPQLLGTLLSKPNDALQWVTEGTGTGGGGGSAGGGSSGTPSRRSSTLATPSVASPSVTPRVFTGTSDDGVASLQREIGGCPATSLRFDRAYAGMLECLFDAVCREFRFLMLCTGNNKAEVNGILEELFGQGEYADADPSTGVATTTNVITHELRRLNQHVLKKLDKLYMLPVLSVVHRYLAAAREEGCVFLESLMQTTLEQVKVIFGAYIREQTNSIQTCIVNVKTTPILPYFVKYRYLLGRIDRLTTDLLNVEDSYTVTLLTEVTRQMFSSLDICAARNPKYSDLYLFRHASYFLALAANSVSSSSRPAIRDSLGPFEERCVGLKRVASRNYIGGMLFANAFPETYRFVSSLDVLLTTHKPDQVQYHREFTREHALQTMRMIAATAQQAVDAAFARLDKHLTRGLPEHVFTAAPSTTSPDDIFHRSFRHEARRLLYNQIVSTIDRAHEYMKSCYSFTKKDVDVPLGNELVSSIQLDE